MLYEITGAKIFGAVGSLIRYKAEVEALVTISRETQGWLTNYNIRHNYSSPWRLSEVLNGHTDLQKSLAQYKEKTSKTLLSVFDKTTVSYFFFKYFLESNCRKRLEEKVVIKTQECSNHSIWSLRVQENPTLRFSHMLIFFHKHSGGPLGD